MLDDKILQQRRAARCVHHLGMELHAVKAPRLIGDGGEGRILGRRHDIEGRRDGDDLVAMAHPDGLSALGIAEPREQAMAWRWSMSARPNSRAWPASTRPPSCSHIVISP